MTYLGRMHGGTVVFESDEKPQEGAAVRVETIEEPVALSPVAKALLSVSGIVEGLPADSSRNVDHYLYGHPKRDE